MVGIFLRNCFVCLICDLCLRTIFKSNVSVSAYLHISFIKLLNYVGAMHNAATQYAFYSSLGNFCLTNSSDIWLMRRITEVDCCPDS